MITHEWRIIFVKKAQKEFQKLPKDVQGRIVDFLNDRIIPSENPRLLAKALTGDKGGLWRYRIGDYRIICDIQQDTVTILVLAIAHRRFVYQ
ncbi:MAG: type II toxin-antitoxin system RelE family toxin [Alphaproteobacteria bacterium]